MKKNIHGKVRIALFAIWISLAVFAVIWAIEPLWLQEISSQGKLVEATENKLKGDELLRQSNFKESLEAYSHALEILPEMQSSQMGKAISLFKLGDTDQALKIYQNLLNNDPDKPWEIYYNLASIYESLSDTVNTISALEKETESSPEPFNSYVRLAKVYYTGGEWQKALQNYLLALDYKPDMGNEYLSALRSYRVTYQLDSLLVKGIDSFLEKGFDQQTAAKYYEQVFKDQLRKNPALAMIYNDVGFCYAKLGNTDQALEFYQNLLNNDPDNPWEIYSNLAFIYKSLHDKENTISALEKEIESSPEPLNSYVRLARVYFTSGEWQKALQNYLLALDYKPDMGNEYISALNSDRVTFKMDSLLVKGIDLFLEKGFDQQTAAKYYEQAFKDQLRKNPALAMIYNDAGFCYAKLGNTDQALKIYQNLLNNDPDNPWEIYSNLAFIYKSLHDKENTISALEKEIEFSPEPFNGYVRLAREYFTSSEWQKALQYYRLALDYKPDMGNEYLSALNSDRVTFKMDSLLVKGIDLFLEKGFDQQTAAKYYEQAFEDQLRKNPTLAMVSHDVGFCYAMLGDIPRSIPFFQSAVKLQPDNKNYQQNLAKAEHESSNK